MSRINVLNATAIIATVILILIIAPVKKEVIIVDNSSKLDSINSKIGQYINAINYRDSVIDSLSNVSKGTIANIRHYTKEYHTKEIITEKIQACDSVIDNCNNLISHYQQADSLHSLQASDYKKVILSKDSVITIKDSLIVAKDKEIGKLNKKVWLWKGLAAAGTTIGLLVR
jgi:hypothetical protein